MAFRNKGPLQSLELPLTILLFANLALAIYSDIEGAYNEYIRTETEAAGCSANANPETPCFRFYHMKRETDNLFRFFMLACSVPVLFFVRKRKNEKVQFLLLSAILSAFGLWAIRIAMLAATAPAANADLFWTAFDTNIVDFVSLAFAISLLIVKLKWGLQSE